MYDWIGANWLWILLGVGLLWFMFGRGGMGCGMGGHGAHGRTEASGKEIPSGNLDPHADHEAEEKQPVAATRGAHRHGGCC